MTKKLIPTALLAIAITASSIGQSAAQNLKVATINTQKVLQGYWKMDGLKKSVKDQEEEIKKTNDAQLEDIKERTAKIKTIHEQLQDTTLPRAQRDKLRQDYKLRFNRLNQSDVSRRDTLSGKIKALNLFKKREQAVMLKDIKKVINEFAAEKGYDFIFDKGQGIGVVLYAKAEYDVSSSILGKLNKDHNAATDTAEAKP